MNAKESILSCGSQNGSAIMLDPEVLDCPVCYDRLTIPIFQCNNGHIVCSTCYNKLRNKCPYCAQPIGRNRCRAMERVIEAIIVTCPNGCGESFCCGKRTTHEKELCAFFQCSCPIWPCNYRGSYKDLYSHIDIHRSEVYIYKTIFGQFVELRFGSEKVYEIILDDYKNGLVFVALFFIEPHGVYVTMTCIAPPTHLEVGEFSCHISTLEPYAMTFEFRKIKKNRELNVQFPQDNDFKLLPSYFFRDHLFKVKISVQKVN